MKTIGIVKLVFMLIEAHNPCLHVSVCVCARSLMWNQVSAFLNRLCGLMIGSLVSLCVPLWSVFSPTAWLV